ncbi:MAG TPA: phytoene desaturase family protein [Rudaea sp.]|nr:phytoene desaturase family protein [Rudaea sp.]
MKSVIVVGAGFAGLSAAIELARRSVQVTVVESQSSPGGRAQRLLAANGYTFDAGPTLLVMTDVLRSVLGPDAFAGLSLERLEPGYSVSWPDGERFEMSSNLARFLEEIARFEGFDRRSPALEYLAAVHEQYLQARAKILDVDHTPLSFLAMLLRPGRFAPWSLRPLLRVARKHFRSDRVVQALTFQPLYLGTSPLRAPGVYAMLAVEEIVGGVWYARGGTGAVVEALETQARALGVTFAYDAPARAVVEERGRARGVRCDAGELRADGVVVTADREPAMRALFAEPPRMRRKVRYGHSAVVWYLGIEGSVELPHHSMLLPADAWSAYAALDRGEVPAEPLVYACNPSISDNSRAPAGHSVLTLLAPVPNASALPRLNEEALFARVLARVEREAGPLRKRIRYAGSRGPHAFASQLQLARGAAFGPDHTLDQMAVLRPSIRHPRIGNVVFAGSGTHPGSGVPMVLISGRLAAQRLLEAIA